MKSGSLCHIDCSSGASGDMLLGAFVDAGMALSHLRRMLAGLDVRAYRLEKSEVMRNGIRATKVDVLVSDEHQPVRLWRNTRNLITASRLPAGVKRNALSIFKNLFEAEARVHGTTIQKAHLHELGAVDCLVDIVGAAVGFEYFGIDRITCSAINVGSGTVKTEHGILPVPAPATSELLKGAPIYSEGPAVELTTPTGAAILATLSSGFGSMPEMDLKSIGHGAGTRDFENRSNVLRLFIGDRPCPEFDEELMVIETNIDDMDPRNYEHVMKRLFEAGARDVWLTPVIMKKTRPAVRLSVLCDATQARSLADVVLQETTTLGVRVYGVGRRILDRKIVPVETPFGRVRVKVASLEGRVLHASAEHDDCRRLAEKHGVPLRRVIAAALKAAELRIKTK